MKKKIDKRSIINELRKIKIANSLHIINDKRNDYFCAHEKMFFY